MAEPTQNPITFPGGGGSGSPIIKYASQLGATLSTNLQTGGGTDDTTILQNFLMPGGSCPTTPVVLVMDGPALITGLKICSNTSIQGSLGALPPTTVTNGPGFYLKTGSNTWVIGNANPSGSSITASNIQISGLFLNGNSGGTGRPNNALQQANHSYNPCIQMWGVSNLTVYNVSALNCAFTGISFSGQNITEQNVRYEFSPNVDLNTGGSDVRGNTVAGGTSNVRIINETMCAGDDGIALNTRNYGSGIVGPFLVGGPITHVNIDGLYQDCTSAPWNWSAIDLISGNGFLMDDITIQHVRGNVQNFCVYINRDRFNSPVDNGNFGDILVDDANCVQQGPAFVGGQIDTGLFPVDGSISTYRLRNIRSAGIADPAIVNATANAYIGQLLTDYTNASVTGGAISTTSFPPVPVENFRYPNGGLPSPWMINPFNTTSALAVASNQLTCTNAAQLCAAIYGNVPLPAGPQFAEVTAANSGGDANGSVNAMADIQTPTFAGSSPGNQYECLALNGNILLRKWVSNSPTTLQTVAQAITAGDRIRIHAQNDAAGHLYCYYNGAVIASQTDTSFSKGSVGVGIFGTTSHAVISKWTGGYMLPDQRPIVVANQGRQLINSDVTVGTGWGTGASAAVCAVPGFVQNFCFTITSGSASFTAAPTVTVLLPVPLPSTATRCHLNVIGITGAGGPIIWSLTTASTTAPVFTATTNTGAAFTPAASETYTVEGGCGP